MTGEVKTHDEGFGFIQPGDGGQEVTVHAIAVRIVRQV